MQSIEFTQTEFRTIIQNELNVTNPVLLKSGVLGVLADYLANIKYDMANYYSTLFREMNPSLARDFNSMLFHSSIYNTELKYADPAKFDVSIVIPELILTNVKVMEYIIPENYSFKDENNLDFIIPDKIQIIQNSSQVTAYKYTKTTKEQLLVTMAPDPTQVGKTIFLVHYDNVLQIKRNYKKIIVPSYNLGESFKFNINITNYKNIKSINSWYNPANNEPIQITDLSKMDPIDVSGKYALDKFDTKFFKFKSNRLSLDLFLNIFDNSISFETGDGRLGKYLNTNDEIIICVEETLGENGNLNNLSFMLTDIQTTITYTNENQELTKYSLNGISINGGKNGKNIQTVDELKENIFNKLSYRNSLSSINDFELFFQNTNGIKPFVDTKFLNGQNFVYIYNTLETKISNNNIILDTYSQNLDESFIAKNPFYPTITINNKELISPFYYKFLSTNETEMYIVNPKIYISLNDEGNLNNENKVILSLNYDFITNKSSFKIDQGANNNLSYYITTDNFSFVLDYANNFTWEVNSLFTDDFCILKEQIFELKLEVRQDDMTIERYYSTDEIYQLIPKQIAFKYYRKNDINTLPEIVDLSEISLGYLDNELRDLLIDATEVLNPYSTEETPILLKLPFVEKSFMEMDFINQYNLLNDFFKITEIQNLVNFNTRVYQCFYNTLYLDDKYVPSVYKKDNNAIKDLKKKIDLNIYIDKSYFDISTTFKTLSELGLSIEIDIINFFKTKRGFQLRYFESELENLIYSKYNTGSDYSYIKNIEILSPVLFIINDSDSIYYNLKDKVTFEELLDFCPPFFQFDLENININITF